MWRSYFLTIALPLKLSSGCFPWPGPEIPPHWELDLFQLPANSLESEKRVGTLGCETLVFCGGYNAQKGKTGVGNGNWDGNVDTLLLGKKWRDSRKERGGMASFRSPWTFLTFWHFSPLTIAYYYPMFTVSDGTWAKLQTYFQSLSVQPCGDGGKNWSPQAHAILFLISLLHGPTLPCWFHLDLSHFPMSYTLFFWRAAKDLCLM